MSINTKDLLIKDHLKHRKLMILAKELIDLYFIIQNTILILHIKQYSHFTYIIQHLYYLICSLLIALCFYFNSSENTPKLVYNIIHTKKTHANLRENFSHCADDNLQLRVVCNRQLAVNRCFQWNC